MPDDFNDRFNAMAYYNHNGSSSTIWDFGDCTSGGRLMQTGTLFSSAWQHYVYTVDPASGMKVYKNGVLVLSQSSSSSLNNRNRDLWVGSGWDAANAQFRFRGSIDDLRLYDRELTPAEIQQLFGLENICSPSSVGLSSAAEVSFHVSQFPDKIEVQAPVACEFVLYDSSGKLISYVEKLSPGVPVTISTRGTSSQLAIYSFRKQGKSFSGKIMMQDF